MWQWLRAAERFVADSPLTLVPPDSDDQFVTVIEQVLQRFKNFVEEQGGWRLLWNEGNVNEKPEEAAQLLFKGVAQSYCEANNIVLDREVNLGRGPVDFKFSNGYAHRALVEVKKLHNGRFWNGFANSYRHTSEAITVSWVGLLRFNIEKGAVRKSGLPQDLPLCRSRGRQSP